MHDAKTYRDRAAHARSKAREVKEPELRVTFETLASGYDALATGAEQLSWHSRISTREPSDVRAV